MHARTILLALSAAAAVTTPVSAGDIFVGCTDNLVYRMVGQNAVALPAMCTEIRALAADGHVLYVGDSAGGLYRVDTFNAMTVQTVSPMLPAPAQSIAAGAGALLVGSQDGKIRRIDPADGQVLNTWTVNSNLGALAMSSQTVIAGGMNTFIYKGSASTGGYSMIAACGGQVTALATNGTLVLAGTPEGVVYRYTFAGAYQGTFNLNGVVISGLAMDGEVLVVADTSGTLRRVNPATGAVISTISAPAPVTSIAVTNGCRPDINADGALNVSDFTAYLAQFSAASMRADMNDDALLNIADFSAFLQQYAAGCN